MKKEPNALLFVTIVMVQLAIMFASMGLMVMAFKWLVKMWGV